MGNNPGSEQRVLISDTYLQENRNASGKSADIDLINLTPVAAFVGLRRAQGRGLPMSGVNSRYEARYISLNAEVSNGTPDTSASDGFVNGRTKGDPFFMAQRFACEHLHHISLRTIRPNGTTGRGIIVHA